MFVDNLTKTYNNHVSRSKISSLGPRNPISVPKPAFRPSGQDRNGSNNQQSVAANQGQRNNDNTLSCYSCSGKTFDECTQPQNLKRCSQDQNYCMVELRTQGDKMVREFSSKKGFHCIFVGLFHGVQEKTAMYRSS